MNEYRPSRALSRTLLALALPAALQLLLRNAYGMNDLYWVKFVGVPQQSAVSLAVMVQILLSALFEGVGLGVVSMAGRVHGAGTGRRARRILGVAVLASLGIAALIAALGLTHVDRYARFLVASPTSAEIDPAQIDAVRVALVEYLRPLFGASFFLCLATVVDSSFVAMRNTKIPFACQVLAILLNLVLNPLLIFGYEFPELGLRIPELGVAGAGWATVLSRAAASLVGLTILLRRLPRHGPVETRSGLELARKMLRVGAPVTSAIAIYSLAYQVIFATSFAEFGPVAHAAFGNGFRLEGLAFCTIWGIAVSSGSLVSNALGAGDPDLAERTIRLSLRVVLCVTVPLSLLFLFAPGPLATLLAEDPGVHDETMRYLRIIALSQFAVGIQGVCDQSLSSAGYTVPVFVSTTFWNLSRIPLCAWLALDAGLGLPGVWWAMNLSSYGKALCSWLLFRAGHWKLVEL